MARYDGAASGDDDARSVVTSPDGTMVFVTGISVGDTIDYATVAYDAATGRRLWRALYNGPADGEDDALAATVTPDGSAVIITGTSQGGDSPDPGGWDYATVAYDAATGAQLWVSRYDGPGHLSDAAGALATSADGSKVFVTGHSVGTTSDDDYTTIAYRVSSGAKLWVRRYNGPGNGGDVATALATSPDGSKLFVTGSSPGSTSDTDYATVAYRAATGARLWLRRYDGPGDGSDGASSVVPSPDGSRVFVTGSSLGTASDLDYATVAYDAETGARLWLSRYNGPGNADDHARAATASPDGSRIFVTGFSAGTSGYDYATLA
ncbi:MAG: hypothetical protein QOE17_300, partial [Gaiellales bacterium]|nr:hypothetical protein [Gaiellales bacterium]